MHVGVRERNTFRRVCPSVPRGEGVGYNLSRKILSGSREGLSHLVRTRPDLTRRVGTGWGVPTLDGGTYLGQGVPILDGVPTLVWGTYLGLGGYLI